MSRTCYFAVIILRGSYRTSYASAQLFRGRRSTFEASTEKSLKRIGILRSSVWSTCHFWRKSRRNASFLSFKASFLEEVSQKCFVFDLQSFIFQTSLAEMFRFWASKLQFSKKSRTKASFLIFKASFLKEVSHKSFVLELQSVIFEGSLEELLRFWASKFHFWRKSRRNALFLCFKLHFWRKSRRNASFLSFKAWFLKEVSQKCFVFDLQSFNFEGSLAEKVPFLTSKLHFWRKSWTKASFWSFKASILKEVSQKSFVLELQNFNFEGSLPEKLWISNRLTTKSLESQINWQPNHLNLKSTDKQNQSNHTSVDNQTHLNLKSIDNQLIWISNQLTTNSLKSQTDWQPNRLNLKSIDNHLPWSSIQQTTKIIWSTHQLTTKSLEAQINWQRTHLNLKSTDNELIWISNHLTAKSFDSQFIWIWHQLTFEPIESPHTPFL